MGTIAEALVSVRVYALSGRKKYIIFIAAAIILAQWCLLLYQDADYVNGTSDVALLLFARELDTSQLPTLPNIDAYRICIAIPGTEDITIGSTFLSLYIVYDGLAVLAIIYFVMQQAKGFRNAPILHLIQRDGLLFFAVMFSSNFVWLMTALHSSRPGLRFIQNQPAMVISSIMVNRITVNLKKAGGELVVVTWSGGENQLITHDGSITAPREDIELASYTPNNQDLKFARNYGCGSKNSHGEHGYKNNSSNVPTDYRN
ncbi:hypothetical protein D9757_003307 [Collybiopsis confluens]|uniref:Uncharacterized protein n=1 Tax=Collybiopsis confluens TaxID=2823264 RepID=A0A8H5MFF8_9AGAR|nr:hypothetical protein D9757_003307 [Collybiopsis confluens]